MQITLHGQTYIVKNNAMKTETISLLQDDDTVALYIAQNRNKIDDYDTILLINSKKETIFPIFLSVFNEMVEDYYMPVIYSFPEFYIIESKAINFAACDFYGISKLPQHINNKYIAYAMVDNTLLVAHDLNERFGMFGNKKAINIPAPRVEKQMVYEKSSHSTTQPQTPKFSPKPTQNQTIDNPIKSTQNKEKQTTTQILPNKTMTKSTTSQNHFVSNPNVQSTKKEGPSRDNLFKYCEIDEHCTILNLVHNNEIVVVNKYFGTIKHFRIADLLENDIIGYDNETDLIKAFGKTVSIMYNTNKICLTDIRNIIRMFEQRKESPVSKQMVAYANDTLYLALASDKALEQQITIKNFTIDCHKNSITNYEKLKAATKAYAKDVYCILTKQNIGILTVSDNGKKANYYPLEDVYASIPNTKNIGDILRLFPIEKIIDGVYFNIDNISQVKTIADVQAASMNLAAEKYTIKGINFGYDRNTGIIVKAPVSLN